MATSGRHRSDGPRVKRTSFGSAEVHGNEDNRRITLTQKLQNYPFPIEVGAEYNVELVEEPEEPPRLELHPVDGGGD